MRSVTARLVLPALLLPLYAEAQNRGVYPLGMSAFNAGALSSPGFSYANQLLLYGRDEAKSSDRSTIVTGSNVVALDLHTLAWSSKPHRGLRIGAAVTIPIAQNSLTSDVRGPVSGGTGFGDAYFIPFIAGWSAERVALRITYGFLAPSARFRAGENDNVGSGYFTHTLALGATVYLLKLPSFELILSAFQLYEFHGTQRETDVAPGQTYNLDHSLLASLVLGERWRVQLGIVGYEQLQTTATVGPGITAAMVAERYNVNALGGGINVVLSKPKASFGFRYFKELANRSTFEGYSVQVAGAIGF